VWTDLNDNDDHYLHRVHRRVHQDEKPFPCPEDDCDKAFKTQAELSRHMFRHTGQKPFKCDQCDKAFIRFDDLKRHYRIHTGKSSIAFFSLLSFNGSVVRETAVRQD
jgi:KRAB domain-containing zinc finger protein